MGSFCVGKAPRRALRATTLGLAGLMWCGAPATAEEAQQAAAQPLSQTMAVTASAPIMMAASGATLPSLADIVERVSPAVVSLTVKITASGSGRGGIVAG